MTGIQLSPTTGDIIISGKTMSIGDVRAQTAHILVVAQRGELREYPLLGLEVELQLAGVQDRGWCLRAKKQLEHCGIPVTRVSQDAQGNIIIE